MKRKKKKIGLKKSGFTLLELVLVIALAMTLMAIAVPNFFSWLPTLRLSAATRQIFMDLRAARMKAIAQNANFQVSFSGSSYVIQKCVGLCTNDSGNILLPEGIIASVSATPQFLPRGTANSATITLSNGVQSQQVEVSLVGRVRII